MKTVQAPEGYYYKKGSVYTRIVNLPDEFDMTGWELATEEEYAAYMAEQERQMLLQEQLHGRASIMQEVEPTAEDSSAHDPAAV